MRAAVATEPGKQMDLLAVRLTDPGPHDVRIAIEAAGVCHSDLKPLDPRTPAANWPFIGGHEGVGVVLEVGSLVDDLVVGQRVLTSFVAPCLRCFWCDRGQQNLCATFSAAPRPKGVTADDRAVFGHARLGVFAEEAVIARAALVTIDSELDSTALALISCGFTTGVSAALMADGLAKGGSAAVFGLGGVGLAAIQGAVLAGAETVIGIDPIPFKRALALKLGATHVFDPSAPALGSAAGDPVVAAVREMTGGRGVDVAFDAYGSARVAAQGFYSTRRGGRLVLIGASPSTLPEWSLHEQMLDSKEVVGALYGGAFPQRDFARIIRLVEAGRLDLTSMVSDVLPLSDINVGLDALRSGRVIRAVIDLSLSSTPARRIAVM